MTSMCSHVCILLLDCENDLSHILHEYGFSLVWVLIWLLISQDFENDLPQTLHKYVIFLPSMYTHMNVFMIRMIFDIFHMNKISHHNELSYVYF